VSTVAFHPEGQCIASGSADKSVKMWDIRSHMLIQHYAAHTEEITSISMHSSGYYLLSASKDSTMKIWDLREGRLLFTLKGTTYAVLIDGWMDRLI
jgi:centriolar protein POC1